MASTLDSNGAIAGHFPTSVKEKPTPAVYLDIFRVASRIKLCDERLRSVIRSGRIASPHYSPRGQEVISAAMAANLRKDDYLVTIYRGLHDHIAKGVPLNELWAEYAGKATGSCKGKGGPMHITHPASGVLVTTGIVGSGIPIANGLAWASQVRGEDRVTVTNFGDGASNIGAFHEGLNLASVWNLPVIFLCQNNGYAEHTKLENGTAVSDIAIRGTAYTMPSITVDGNDATAMWQASRAAVTRARNGGGPTLIEAKTFRFEGHNFGDPGHYIPKEEYESAKLRDPMPRLRGLLLESNYATEGDLVEIEAAIGAEIDAAVQFALDSPYPAEDELHSDVYSKETH
jgi:acetoin:2,6-dichlorophenolindophenol oxidoreductase subunit alpha